VLSGLAELITCIPDPNDRHVVAAALCAKAEAIVTFNTRHFPPESVQHYGIVCHTPDEFLAQQFELNRELVLDRLDSQAATLNQERSFILRRLARMTPFFVRLVELEFRGGHGAR
jgi:hypothetical protein